ncbi:thiamine/thiamine pyrophosphate ABC transporter permease ThiP [Neorhizobium sp. CSC1952]|uniref:thiamine/thiamine pyrophosphate ABC transporter permease ThiP n=1 Tax=Neorhizobium sp. CSC1952 TaxID=2978974 RepID=UPI0025A5D843|nr:thiamine/thiamine pyrophosphate ABC transporter permease ThiP [Rhizobium sp. CSC1952]WJR69475.1 thiamine/thiamine pyrophosphate ABC transporter permease ThiP [Rhizobium sp. CSC1952]
MLLTHAERRRGIAWGLTSFLGIALFAGAPIAVLLSWDVESTQTRLFTAYTWRILRFTLWQAVLSTALSIAFAIPVALALARRPHFPGRLWIVRLMALPMGLPVLIGALGLIGIWGRQGIINSLLLKLGLEQPVSIYGLSGILLAHVFFNMPLAARLLLAALERLPAEYWPLSAGLGMKPLSVFRFIEWPAVRRVIPGIAGLIFMLCATSFTLVLVLGGGPAATTLEVAIYQSLRFDFDPPRAIALAFPQIGMTALILLVITLFPTPDDAGATAGRITRRFDGRTLPALFWDVLAILLATAFLILPLASIATAGLGANLWSLVTSAAFLRAARTSFAIALAAGLLTILVSLAIVAAREAVADMKRPGRIAKGFSALLGGTSYLVLLVPPVVLGTGWFLMLRPLGDVARFAPVLVAAINALMALPFVMRVLAPAIETHRKRTGRLSASLGISGLSRLWRIDLPVLAKPLLTAFSFAMALSLGDLGAVALFGSGELTTLPWLVYSRLSSYRTNDADGLALILGIICLGLAMLGTAGQREAKHG